MSFRLTAVALCALALLAGCDSVSGARRVSDHVDLVNDLAVRLDGSTDLTYTAEYQLPGGREAIVMQAQDPQRWAFVHPGGKLGLTPDRVLECRRAGATERCTLRTPPSPSVGLDPALVAATQAAGLMPTSVVLELLFAAAVDSNASVEQHDSTIAGQHATCVDVTQVDNAVAADFSLCVTTDGVLGSFSGLVQGKQVDLTLTGYRDSVPPDAFSVPERAQVTDERSAG